MRGRKSLLWARRVGKQGEREAGELTQVRAKGLAAH